MNFLNHLFLIILAFTSIKITSMEQPMPALHSAVLENNLEKVQSLIEQGYDIHQTDMLGATAFDYAVRKKEYKKIAAYLYPNYFDLKNLQNTIGYEFKDVKKLIKAFTLKAICPNRNYEIYEWLGDAILHEVLAQFLYKSDYGHIDENLLTCARVSLEQKETLAELSQKLEFGNYIIGNNSNSIKVDILEDVVESLIAAIYKDGGVQAAQAFILRYWLPMINNSGKLPMNPLSILDKWKKETQKKVKEYKLKTSDGFKYQVEYGNITSIIYAPTVRMARYYAIRKFIMMLPQEYEEYKNFLLISPLSDEYKVSYDDLECTMDMSAWETKLMLFPFSYNLQMISQMLGYYKPIFKIEKSGEDHNPIFICSVQFEGIEGMKMGEIAKTKRKAREHAAQLAFEEWRSHVMRDLQMGSDRKIDIKKLIFLVKIKRHFNSGNKNSRILWKELCDQEEYGPLSYKDYILGGEASDPKSSWFYSVVTCPGMVKKPLRGNTCSSKKEAQESAAQMFFTKFLEKVRKGN